MASVEVAGVPGGGGFLPPVSPPRGAQRPLPPLPPPQQQQQQQHLKQRMQSQQPKQRMQQQQQQQQQSRGAATKGTPKKARARLLSEGFALASFAVPPKQQHCVRLLSEGFAQAFVDFFYLTHTRDSAAGPSGSAGGSSGSAGSGSRREGVSRTKELSPESLQVLHETLSAAETAQRKGDIRGVVAEHTRLAVHFDSLGNVEVAVHFLEKCLKLSEELGDRTLEVRTQELLGKAMAKLGKTLESIAFFEKSLGGRSPGTPAGAGAGPGADAGSDAPAGAGLPHLVAMYDRRGAECEEEGNNAAAVEARKQGLDAAQRCGDRVAEGHAHYRLGLCYKHLNLDALFVREMEEYLAICRATEDRVGECVALSSLAEAHMKTGEVGKSVECLTENIRLAEQSGQVITLARAWKELGMIRSQSGNHQEGIACFEKYLEIARRLEKPALMDDARVYLGVARGTMLIEEEQRKQQTE